LKQKINISWMDGNIVINWLLVFSGQKILHDSKGKWEGKEECEHREQLPLHPLQFNSD
jgi:hypothetical protein